jgi:hypothetical protein
MRCREVWKSRLFLGVPDKYWGSKFGFRGSKHQQHSTPTIVRFYQYPCQNTDFGIRIDRMGAVAEVTALVLVLVSLVVLMAVLTCICKYPD